MKDLRAIFNPESMAIVGASNNPSKWGWVILANILAYGYRGRVYPVNPHEEEILGLKVYPSILDAPKIVDLAFIVRPASSVFEYLEECVERGVKAAIVLPGGFRETGEEGRLLEEKITKFVEEHNLLLVGPNTMGVFSASANLCAVMPPVRPRKGEVSIISQSGNIGTNLLSFGSQLGIGFNKFISTGNEASLNVNDYLEYLGKDPETKIILIYVEGITRGREFLDLAVDITLKKPIIVYKGSVSEAGMRAALSHTGAFSSPHHIYEGVFRQAGIIQAPTIDNMLELARGFLYLPLPKSRRIGMVSWGGGYGIVTADLCERAGLEVAQLSKSTIEELDRLLPPFWSRGNPVDLVGLLDRTSQPAILEALVKSKDIDSVIASGFLVGDSGFDNAFDNLPGFKDGGKIIFEWRKRADEINIEKISRLVENYKKPIVVVTLITDSSVISKVSESKVVGCTSHSTAVEVIAKMYEYYRYLLKREKQKRD
jgi:acyl-CoA synthetase (NDP forming)